MNWPLEEKKKAESIFRKLVFDGLGDARAMREAVVATVAVAL